MSFAIYLKLQAEISFGGVSPLAEGLDGTMKLSHLRQIGLAVERLSGTNGNTGGQRKCRIAVATANPGPRKYAPRIIADHKSCGVAGITVLDDDKVGDAVIVQVEVVGGVGGDCHVGWSLYDLGVGGLSQCQQANSSSSGGSNVKVESLAKLRG